jgi:hypothetical protein
MAYTVRGDRSSVLRRAAWLAPVIGCLGASLAMAQQAGQPMGPDAAGKPAQPPLEPPKYPVSKFVITYASENPGHPDPESILSKAVVKLGTVGGGYVEPREGVPTVELRVSDIANQPMQRFNLLALSVVVKSIFEAYRSEGLVGVVVDASGDIYLPMRRDPQTGEVSLDRNDPNVGKDLRPEKRPGAATELHLTVFTGVVTQVRTQATGDRIGPDEDRIDNPAHAWIRDHSPVQPTAAGQEGGDNLLHKGAVDDYMARLNRHPGRRVDAAVSAGAKSGEITLDYIVNESKPWTVFFQISNTGTKETNEWRERFGFSHSQLTGHDDVLSIDYVTAGFDASNAVLGSYEFPIGDSREIRAKVYGNWNQYTASDVGFAGEKFKGDGWLAGAELTGIVYQSGQLFIDLFGGARWQNVSVKNEGLGTTGETDFLVPYIGLRLDRQTDINTTFGSVTVEGNLQDLAGTKKSELDNLGRLQTDDSWVALRWDATHSFYLEPLIARESWEDVNRSPTLAHEVSLSFRGQWAFDYRLVPNYEQVIGGAYSVRGYPESVAAGDSSWVASAEYRWHIPWGLAYDSQPGTFLGETFRWRPQQPYGRADWDSVVRAFVDVGQTYNSSKLSFEHDETLVGAGVGLELVYRKNASVRVDWGVALRDTNAGRNAAGGGFIPDVTAGSNRFHISATLLY